ncbi:cysteine protease rdl2-related [Anaeramoeba flamelloides]|uniref:Cysteine protease rdl2-related n=1 Tax=Anaeramoeba flamelloides TaxID=1746091 RepID=A0ABQ8YF88_9EUKA|nr:cysteine protease rdl2-related [Anaeramoeba flamelloides]
MRFCLFLVLLVFSINVCAQSTQSKKPLQANDKSDSQYLQLENLNHEDEFLFELFNSKFKKKYETESESMFRLKIFKKNLEQIREHNSLEGVTFKMGITQFVDWTREEYLAGLQQKKINLDERKKYKVFSETGHLESTSPDEMVINWVTKGAVTAIKDQKDCGSCWTFSATGVMEGRNFVLNRKLISLSESEIIDCDQNCAGCNGCLVEHGLEWVASNGGLCSEQDYPYVPSDQVCSKSKCKSQVNCSEIVFVKSGDEDALAAAVQKFGPISISIDASTASFEFYKGGVYYGQECSPSLLDHDILVVGYGTLNGQDVWLVKNQWGTSWGDNGYVYMSRNRDNNCGIASSALFPMRCTNY